MPGKRLYRSSTDKKIAGVCGGIAEYFDIDPVFVRIGAFILTVPHGLGVIVYLVCWAAVPMRPGSETAAPSEPPAQSPPVLDTIGRSTGASGELIVGGILILIGFFFLMFNVGLFDLEFFRFWRWRFVWPVIVIALGVYVVTTSLRSAGRGAGKGAL